MARRVSRCVPQETNAAAGTGVPNKSSLNKMGNFCYPQSRHKLWPDVWTTVCQPHPVRPQLYVVAPLWQILILLVIQDGRTRIHFHPGEGRGRECRL